MPRKKFIWDDENILMEKDEFGVTQKTYTLEPQLYGNLVSEFDGTDTLHHHYDALGSTRQLTDQNGDLTDDYVYDAWGNLIQHTGMSQVAFLWIGALGYYTDQETEQIQVRARDFRPTLGRWTSRDPIGHRGGDLNLYQYVMSSPIQRVDPSGQAQLGVGLGLGGTIVLPVVGAPLPAVGLHGSYSIQGFLYTGGRWPISACVCSTATLGVSVGVGAGGSLGPYFAVTVGPGTPTDGFSLTIGGGVGLGAPVATAPLEVTVDVDVNTQVTTVTIGKLTAGVYGVVRISGNCTGCSAYIWQFSMREKKIRACMSKIIPTLKKALTHITTKPVKPKTTLTFQPQQQS